MSLDGLQTFCPVDLESCGDGCVPLEVLIDYRCESDAFDRIVPQTNATCQYDRFNRLRLRNNVTSVTRSVPDNEHRRGKYAHLQNETVRLTCMTFPHFIDKLTGSGPSPYPSVLCFCQRPSFPIHI